MSIKIYIGADIVPTSSNISLFENEEKEKLIGKSLVRRFEVADYIIMNLETPLTDKNYPIDKCGPNLSAPTKTIKGLKAINPYFYTLANNHIMDQGANGLDSTIKVLNNNNISYCGVGNNLEDAKKPFIVNLQNIKIGIYCCVEHEFSIATSDTPGANPFDPLESFDDVQDLRNNCDYLIVLYHGGKEHYRYPSPTLQKVFRKFADKGADLIVSQHTHCIGCEEKYKNSTLIYGQGNFLFDHSKSEYWKTSLLIELNINTIDKSVNISYVPIIKNDNCVTEADTETSRKIMEEYDERSKEISKEGVIKTKYNEFAISMEKEYYYRFAGKISKNLLFRILNKISSYRLVKALYSKKDKLEIENVLDCESHRELCLQAIRVRSY